MEHCSISALDRACDAFGSQGLLADALGIKSPSISDWRKRESIPWEQADEIEVIMRARKMKNVVTRRELCPHHRWDEPAKRARAA